MTKTTTGQTDPIDLPSKRQIFGVEVALTSYQEALGFIQHWARSGDRAYLIAAANTHVVTFAGINAEFRRALQSFDLIVPDGMPLIWYLNSLERAGLPDRVYGPELMVRALQQASDPSLPHFFLGGSDQMRRKLLDVVATRFPKVPVAGSYSPPFGTWPAQETTTICNLVRESGARIVWVGLGCPKQELLLHSLREQLPPAVYLAVGAAFPLISGQVRQAPPYLQRVGMEWAFRLLMEPRRLWKRYLIHNALFIWLTFDEIIKRVLRRYQLRPRYYDRP